MQATRMITTLPITFRYAEPHDAQALAEIRVEAMRESLERIGHFDAARARGRFLSNFPAPHTRHIELDGERVGFFVVRPEGDGLLLEHLYIRPRHQGKGVGAVVLEQVFAEADTVRLPVRVGALRGSASNRFFARHGFALIGQGEFDLYYVRRGKDASKATGPRR